MLKRQIESWALRLIDQFVKKQPNEDALVELKTDWLTDHAKAARHLAGHANSARGQRILWLIGVDEKAHTVPGASHAQFADWFAQVTSCFDDGVSPTPTEINVPYNGNTVVAIAFETD